MGAPRTIGVLGGMGPEAAILFMQKMLAAVKASDDGDHVPLIVDQNTQVPSRIARLIEGRGEDPAPVLKSMARRLEAAGAQALVMPCNTAHHYAAQVAEAVNIPFLNMVDMAAAEGARLVGQGGQLGLLGSPALAKVGVFDPALAAQGLSACHGSDPDGVLATIKGIKANGPSDIAAQNLTATAQDMAARGAGAICICCTEFSLLAHRIASPVPLFDALDLAVAASVQFALAPEGQPINVSRVSQQNRAQKTA